MTVIDLPGSWDELASLYAGQSVALKAAQDRIAELEEQVSGLHELFKINQRDIREEVGRALGYEQTASALTAVRRLADRLAEEKRLLKDAINAANSPRIVKTLTNQDGQPFCVYLSCGRR